MTERDTEAALIQMADIGGCRLGEAMRVTFSQVRGFVTVASTGSFTRAAEVLHLSQPALTTRIRQLEEALDLRLFDRNTRTVTLTDAGRELLPIFMRLVSDLEGAVVNARDHAKRANSIIRFACLPSCAATLVPDLISRFRAERPDASFVVEDAINAKVRALVREGQVDFGICAYEGDEPDLLFEDLFEDNLQAVFRPGHPIGNYDRIGVPELIRHPLILTNRGSSVRDVVDQAFAASGLTAAPACETTYMSTAVALVSAGLGVAILPSTAVEVRAPGVVARPVDDLAFRRRLGLVRRRAGSVRRIVQAFIEEIVSSTRDEARRLGAAS